jgi:DNA processing protein
LQANDSKSISIVGTRAATTYGKLATEKFVEQFVRYNLVIVSGLARGIDTKVHIETIKNKGITYAIVASGLDCIKPAISNKNAEKIVESGGAIISEYPCGTKALPGYFPQRNRIISGISVATLVIESADKGGSLITAKFAFDQGRDVFAVPGNIFSEKSAGTNSLIAANIAAIAKSPDYVITELGIADGREIEMFKKEKEQTLEKDEKSIIDLLNHEPRHIDDIADKADADINTVLVTLLKLEFKGLITQLPGKYYIKT